jgi:NAD+ kinase
MATAPAIRTAAIITKIGSAEAEAGAATVAKLLLREKVKVYSLLPLKLEGSNSVKVEDLNGIKLDVIFAIGGDGTTLRAFRTVPGNAPLFGIISGGHRGILAEIESEMIESAVSDIVAGRYFYDSRIRIQAFVGTKSFPPALNDILITRVSLTRTPVVSIKLMGDEIKQRMDGIVISTPTGSTGHSFSIGGPVLHEGMDCLILSPIASVNRMPQLVMPVEEITIRSSHESHLIVDGQETFKIEPETSIRILRYADDAVFLRLQKKGMRQLARLGFSKLGY